MAVEKVVFHLDPESTIKVFQESPTAKPDIVLAIDAVKDTQVNVCSRQVSLTVALFRCPVQEWQQRACCCGQRDGRDGDGAKRAAGGQGQGREARRRGRRGLAGACCLFVFGRRAHRSLAQGTDDETQSIHLLSLNALAKKTGAVIDVTNPKGSMVIRFRCVLCLSFVRRV